MTFPEVNTSELGLGARRLLEGEAYELAQQAQHACMHATAAKLAVGAAAQRGTVSCHIHATPASAPAPAVAPFANAGGPPFLDGPSYELSADDNDVVGESDGAILKRFHTKTSHESLSGSVDCKSSEVKNGLGCRCSTCAHCAVSDLCTAVAWRQLTLPSHGARFAGAPHKLPSPPPPAGMGLTYESSYSFAVQDPAEGLVTERGEGTFSPLTPRASPGGCTVRTNCVAQLPAVCIRRPAWLMPLPWTAGKASLPRAQPAKRACRMPTSHLRAPLPLHLQAPTPPGSVLRSSLATTGPM